MKNSRLKAEAPKNFILYLHSMRADALTGFIAGFIIGVMGMYVYVIILATTLFN